MKSARSVTKISTLTTQFRPDRRAWTKEREALERSPRAGSHWKQKSGSVSQVFADDRHRLFIFPHGDEGAMPQVSGISPFEECHLANQFRCDPVAFLHLFRSQRLAPPRGPFLGRFLNGQWTTLSFWRAGRISSRFRDTKPSFTTKMSFLFS
jgi:hypothetical protein